MLINRTSLSQTVDAINAAHFSGRSLPAAERSQAARWIAGRQGLPGAYSDTFAGFPSERSKGIVLFTGERITSASARHILGEEASRALRQLRVRDPKVTRALEGADNGLMRCLARAADDPRNSNPGLYCCGKCSVGLWRNLLAGGLDRREERLATRRLTSAFDARRRTSMATISFLVHRAGAERDGQRRSEDGVEVCGARAGARGEPCCAVSGLCTTPARAGRSNAERSLIQLFRSRSPARGVSAWTHHRRPLLRRQPDGAAGGTGSAAC